MGAWGVGNLANDDASDWLAKLLEEKRNWDFPVQAIERILEKRDPPDSIPSFFCCDALAAAEVVAASLGNPAPSFPAGAAAWARKNAHSIPPDLRRKTLDAVGRIKTGSDLKGLWLEASDSTQEWYAVIDDLVRRLSKT